LEVKVGRRVSGKKGQPVAQGGGLKKWQNFVLLIHIIVKLSANISPTNNWKNYQLINLVQTDMGWRQFSLRKNRRFF